MSSSHQYNYEIESYLASGSFGKVYSASVTRSLDANSEFSRHSRSLQIDDQVVIKSALITRVNRVKDLRGEPHSISLDESGTGFVSGDAFEPRELQMSALLGKRLDVNALIKQEIRQLRKRSRSKREALSETEMPRSSKDETEFFDKKMDETEAIIHDDDRKNLEMTEVSLFPTLFDAFFVYDSSLGEKPKDGGSINLIMVSEVKGNDLWVLINTQSDRFIHDSFRREIVRQSFEMLSRLHMKGLIHRDLKLPNLLLDFSPSGFPLLRLGDCGSTRSIPEENFNEGTPYVTSRFYRAPELLCGSSVYGNGVDLWSIGCTLAELYMQLASTTDARASASLSLLRGDGSSNPQTKQNSSRRRCALFHGAKNDGAQICQILNLLGPPTDEDLKAMKIPIWASDWLRAQRWFINTSATIEASGSLSLMQQFMHEIDSIQGLGDSDIVFHDGSDRIPEIPIQLSNSLKIALSKLERIQVGPVDMRSLLFEHCSMPKDIADLLARCFLWNPSKRITCNDALLHPALLHAQPHISSFADAARLDGKKRCSEALDALLQYTHEKEKLHEQSNIGLEGSLSSSHIALDFASLSSISTATSSL
jgi:serine/threonine protein kinase